MSSVAPFRSRRILIVVSAGIAALGFVVVPCTPAVGQDPEGAEQRKEEEVARKRSHAGDTAGVLEDLERGMRALRTLKCMDLLEQLEKVAAEVKSGAARRHDDRAPADKERAAGRRQVAMARHGLEVLKEADREDSASLLERWIRTVEVSIEGRDDEEARKIRSRCPDRPQTFELLNFAAHHAKAQGKPDIAEGLAGLAEEVYGKQFRASQRAEAETSKRGADRPGRGGDGRDPKPEPHDRVERLEQQIQRLGQAIEKLQDELRALADRKR